MGNEVRTEFTADPTQLFKTADAVEARLKSVNARINQLGQNPTFGGGNPLAAPSFQPVNTDSVKALKEAASLQITIAQQEKAIEAAKQATLKTEREQLSVLLSQTRLKSSELSLKTKTDKLSNSVDVEAARTNAANAAIANFEKQRVLISKSSLTEIERGEKALTRIKIGEAKTANDAAIREIKERERAEKQAQSSGAGGGNLFGQILGGNLAARAITEVSSAALSGGKSVLDYSANLEQARIGLTTITGSAVLAGKHLKDLQDFAKTTPFEFSELVTASQKLQGVGFAAENVIPTLKDVGSALSASGRIGDLPFAIKALGDIQAKGKLAGQEIIQLANAGLPAVRILSGALGKTSAEILELSENGQISSEVFLKALRQYSQANFGGALEAQSKTFRGAISNISDALGQTSEVAFRPLFGKISSLAGDIATEVGKNEGDLIKVGKTITTTIAKGFGSTLGDQLRREIADIRSGKLNPFELQNATSSIGGAFADGTTGGRSLPSLLSASYRLSFKTKGFTTEDLPDLKQLSFTGKFDADIARLEKEKETETARILEAITFSSSDFSPIRGGNSPISNLSKFSPEVGNFKLNAVDNDLQYMQSRINARGDDDNLSKIRESSELEQLAIKEKIRLQKQLFDQQARSLSAADLGGAKGLALALEAVQTVSKLEKQAETVRLNAQKQINEEIKKGIEKVKELGKQYNAVFDGLLNKANKDNPIATVFAEGRKELESLKESIRGLSPELQAQAISMQKTINENNLFGARLDDKLAGLDLRDQADDFRSFKTSKIADTGKFFEDFIEAGLKQISNSNGGGLRYNLTGDGKTSTQGFSQSNADPFTRFNSNIFTDSSGKQFTNGFSQSDARNDLFYSYNLTGDGKSTQGFSQSRRTFADLTQKEKDDFIRAGSDPNGVDLKFQQRLDRQVLAAQNSGALNDEQRRLVDRKLISLTQGIDPSKLRDDQRDTSAAAREREATRIDQNEAKKIKLDEDRNALLERVAVSNETLIGLANKGGSSAIELLLKDQTASGAASELKPAATAKDVRQAYDDSYKSGTFYGDYEKSK